MVSNKDVFWAADELYCIIQRGVSKYFLNPYCYKCSVCVYILCHSVCPNIFMLSFGRVWWSPEQPSRRELHFPWVPSVQLQQQPQLWVADSEPTAHQFLYRGADRRPAPGEPPDLWVRLPPVSLRWVPLKEHSLGFTEGSYYMYISDLGCQSLKRKVV